MIKFIVLLAYIFILALYKRHFVPENSTVQRIQDFFRRFWMLLFISWFSPLYFLSFTLIFAASFRVVLNAISGNNIWHNDDSTKLGQYMNSKNEVVAVIRLFMFLVGLRLLV